MLLSWGGGDPSGLGSGCCSSSDLQPVKRCYVDWFDAPHRSHEFGSEPTGADDDLQLLRLVHRNMEVIKVKVERWKRVLHYSCCALSQILMTNKVCLCLFKYSSIWENCGWRRPHPYMLWSVNGPSWLVELYWFTWKRKNHPKNHCKCST